MSVRVHDTGADAFLSGLEREAAAHEPYVIEHENDSDAAAFLQAREGYFVYNDGALLDPVEAAAQEIANHPEPLTRPFVIEQLKGAAREGVAFHRAYAGGFKPPLRAGAPSRPIRAGSWADRRGVTADAYQSFVEGERVSDLPGPEGQNLQ